MRAALSYLFLFFTLTSISTIASAQRLPTPEVLTVDDGLCFRRVNSIAQDHEGLMWFGTAKGLSRYDGRRFINFTKNALGDKNFQWDELHKDGLVFRSDSILWAIADDQLVSINIINFDTKLVTGFEGKPKSFLSAKQGDILFVTDTEVEQHLFRFTAPNGFEKLSSVPRLKTNLSTIQQDTTGNIWWSSTAQGLQNYNLKGDLVGVETDLEQLYFHDENTIYTDFFIDSRNRFFIYSMKTKGLYELWQYFPESGEKKTLAAGYTTYFFSAKEDSWGNIWFGLDEQLLELRPDNKLVDFTHKLPRSIDYSIITAIFEDSNNLLWVGTNGGLFKIPIYKQLFQNHFAEDDLGWSNSIRGIGEDKNGDLFFFCNSGDPGFYRIAQGSSEVIKMNFGLSDQDLLDLIDLATYFIYDEERNCIWAVYKSLIKLDMNADKIEIYPEINLAFDNRDFNPLALMADGQILLGNSVQQMAVYNPELRQLLEVQTASPQDSDPILIKTLLPIDENRFWVSTLKDGIYLFDLDGQELKHYHTQSKPAINNNHVLCIHQEIDADWIWIGTYGGGFSGINLRTEEIREYNEQDGLSDNHVVSIMSEGDNLWLGTYNGLSRFDKKTKTFRNYYEEDGLTDNEFNYTSFFQSQNGKMYFGGMNGINFFDANDVVETGNAPPLMLTHFSKYDQGLDSTLHFQSKDDLKGPFVISPDVGFFQFEWTMLSYVNQKKTQYFTWLEGLEEDYSSIGNTPNLRFNKLPPGEYTLHLKGKDSKGNSSKNPLTIPISVLPPWWKTWWAYSLFILSTIGALAFIRRRETRRLLLQNRLEKESIEADRLRELDETKTRLYANISHEFRTPLTIISGMADQMDENPKQWFDQGISMIKRNSRRLLVLVNQMLDLSKLESEKMGLNLQQGDLVNYLKYIIASIHSFAEGKNIKVHLLCEEEELIIDFDQEKIHQVMINLLSNAIKFTKDGGDIYVSVELISAEKNEHALTKKALQIKVKDTGIGILADQIPFVFDRFYQVTHPDNRQNEGTGIGLALVKELIKLMHGDISVKSKVGHYTVFTVLLPITNEAKILDVPARHTTVAKTDPKADRYFDSSTYVSDTIDEDSVSSLSAKPSILLVEDNADVVAYVASCLQADYDIQVGKDGEEGIQIAFDNIPDLIISDVMMPIKDGFEVARILKSDERTSHIPIILLTAKADIESKLEGLSTGVDAYLAKPFHKKELLIRIEKLLELRRNLQKHYLASLGIATLDSDSISDAKPLVIEDSFGQKVKLIVEAHIADHEFTVEVLCKEINLSHSQLHRKLTALTGLSPVKFIRQVRLTNAKILLQKADTTVSEAAYGSGFSDPSYFSRVFKKEFGVAPLEWKNM